MYSAQKGQISNFLKKKKKIRIKALPGDIIVEIGNFFFFQGNLGKLCHTLYKTQMNTIKGALNAAKMMFQQTCDIRGWLT